MNPVLFTLMTHDCIPRAATNHIVKFANSTKVVGLIRDDNNLAYREEVEQLVGWWRDNKLILNVDKTKEIIVNFRKKVRSSRSTNTVSLVKRAQQHLHYLHEYL